MALTAFARQISVAGVKVSASSPALSPVRTNGSPLIIRWNSRTARRLERLGIGPDGKPLPMGNSKKIFPRMYKALVVNQDGSTEPYKILTLPLDLSKLTEEQKAARARQKLQVQARVYVEDKLDEEEDNWDQSGYRDLIRKK
ncbi:hypothetical protein EMCRGX_G019041 [Ephydatia muelleri]